MSRASDQTELNLDPNAAQNAQLPRVEAIAAGCNQQPLIDDLLQLYIEDFGDFVQVDKAANGRFVYDQLPLYWLEPGRRPLLLIANNQVAGFALVKQELTGSPGALWDMAEFFILPNERRHRLGTAAACAIWRQFPGPWQVRVMESNRAAYSFWEHAIAQFSKNHFEHQTVEWDGRRWRVFHFESNAAEVAGE